MTRAALTLLAATLAAVATLAPAPVAAAQDAAPSLRARAAILMEASRGEVVYQRNADQRRPIASATKLMTALLALEGAPLDDVITAVPYQPLAAESVIGLRAGERMTVRDLVRALLLPSANDAAVTVADGISGSQDAFVREMNARAQELGLENTRFANPVGLDEAGNGSSARDLVRLVLALRRFPFFRETVDLPRVTLTSGARRRVVQNRNLLVRQEPFVNGVKTGRTLQAGYVLVASGTRDGVTMVTAVLGEPSEAARNADALALLRHGLRRYRRTTLLRRGARLRSAEVKYEDAPVGLVAGESVRRVVRRGARPRLRVLGAPDEVEGPLPAGSRVGRVEVRLRGKLIDVVPLVTAAPVAEAGLGTRLAALLSRPVSLLLIALVLVCTVLLVLLRRRVMHRAGAVR